MMRSRSATALVCPQCGAEVAPGRFTCPSCKRIVSTLSAPWVPPKPPPEPAADSSSGAKSDRSAPGRPRGRAKGTIGNGKLGTGIPAKSTPATGRRAKRTRAKGTPGKDFPAKGAPPDAAARRAAGKGKRRSPWTSLAAGLLLCAVAVGGSFVAVAKFYKSPAPSTASYKGKCVVLASGTGAHRSVDRSVDCGASHDGVVLAVVKSGARCPAGTTAFPRTDTTGMLCVQEVNRK